jgi:hypothetical protein
MLLRALAVPFAVMVLGIARPAAAAPEMAPPGPLVQAPSGAPDPLRVFVMTMGPGDHPFFRFGHNAIWIRDERAPSDRVYNFGTFRFDSPRMILDFLGGRLNYWLSVSSLPPVIAEYRRENRSVAIQELSLPPAAKVELQAALDLNARRENRLYKYDYFLDNCSTRVRDAIDRQLQGGFHATALAPGRLTLREHALRMTAQPLWLYLALDIVLGPQVDKPIDQWTEMFLPEELARDLDTTVGGRALVRGQVELVHADRPATLLVPPARTPKFLAWGIAVGLAIFALGWGGARSAWARVPFGIVVALWGLVTGFIGSFLVYAWMLTDHVVTHRNQNILLCAPWALAHVVLGVGVALGWVGATRKAFALAAAALAAVVAACLIKIGFVAYQQNTPLIAFFVPAWVGVTAALWWLARARASGAR